MQPTKTTRTEPRKIKGLPVTGYGTKFRYSPPFYGFVQGGPGTIVSVHPLSADDFEPEELHDTPEKVERTMRAFFIKEIESLISVRDKHKMWNSSHDPREVMVDGLRLLKAGIDMDSKKILQSLDTLPPMR